MLQIKHINKFYLYDISMIVILLILIVPSVARAQEEYSVSGFVEIRSAGDPAAPARPIPGRMKISIIGYYEEFPASDKWKLISTEADRGINPNTSDGSFTYFVPNDIYNSRKRIKLVAFTQPDIGYHQAEDCFASVSDGISNYHLDYPGKIILLAPIRSTTEKLDTLNSIVSQEANALSELDSTLLEDISYNDPVIATQAVNYILRKTHSGLLTRDDNEIVLAIMSSNYLEPDEIAFDNLDSSSSYNLKINIGQLLTPFSETNDFAKANTRLMYFVSAYEDNPLSLEPRLKMERKFAELASIYHFTSVDQLTTVDPSLKSYIADLRIRTRFVDRLIPEVGAFTGLTKRDEEYAAAEPPSGSTTESLPAAAPVNESGGDF